MSSSKVATVIVSHGNDRIAIKSKTELAIDFTVLGVTYTQAENNLFSRIERGPSPRPMELTYSELSTFKGAYERFLQAQSIDSKSIASVDRIDTVKPSNVEAPAPAPAPAPTIQGLERNALGAFRMATMKGSARVYPRDPIDESEIAERSIRRFEEALRMVQEDGFILIQYDIKDTKKDVCPNPSKYLWKLGARTSLSVWMLPKKAFDDPRLQADLSLWREHKLRHSATVPDRSSYAILAQEIQDELRAQIIEWHQSLITKIDSAAERIGKARAEVLADESKGSKELETAENKEHNAMRAHIRESIDRLDSAIKCAEKFDDSMETRDLIDSLRHAIRAEAEAFNALARAKRIKPAPMPS